MDYCYRVANTPTTYDDTLKSNEAIWVDDITISATTLDLLTSVKETLCRKSKMKDLGKLSWFLGTNFKCNKDSIEMGQTQYIDKILSKFKLTDCKPKSTPCALGVENGRE